MHLCCSAVFLYLVISHMFFQLLGECTQALAMLSICVNIREFISRGGWVGTLFVAAFENWAGGCAMV